MYAFLIVFHIIAGIFLIAVILLQAGRGSGLADTFGGSQLQNLFGTKSTTILTRLTSACAATFIFTCLALAIISSHKARSVVDKMAVPVTEKEIPLTAQSPAEESQSVEEGQAPAEVNVPSEPQSVEVIPVPQEANMPAEDTQ